MTERKECPKEGNGEPVTFILIPPCASHTPAEQPEAQQRIDAAIKELERATKDYAKIGLATIDPEGKAFWRGRIKQAEEAIALLQDSKDSSESEKPCAKPGEGRGK